jgi:hypothetical protein
VRDRLSLGSIAFVLDCHVWSNNSVRVTARNVSLSSVDLPAAALHVQVVKRRVG